MLLTPYIQNQLLNACEDPDSATLFMQRLKQKMAAFHTSVMHAMPVGAACHFHIHQLPQLIQAGKPLQLPEASCRPSANLRRFLP